MLRRKGLCQAAGGALACALVIGISGCSKAGDESADQAYSTLKQTSRATADYGGADNQAPLHTASRQVGAERSVMRQATLAVQVDDLDKAEKAMKATIATKGGYIDKLDGDNLAGEEPQLRLTIRVPEKSFEDILTDFETLGKRTQKSVTASDLTEQILDAEARLQQVERDRSTLLVQGKGVPMNPGFDSMKDRIKELQAEKEALVLKASMSTINLTLQQKPDAGASTAANANWGSNTWNSALSSAMGAFRVIGAVAIWLLAYSPIWALLLIASLWGFKIWRRSNGGHAQIAQ